MEIYLPTLESKMMALVVAFRILVFALMVVGLIAHVAGHRSSPEAIFRALVKALIIVAALAYQDVWFQKVEDVILTVAEYVDPGYNEHPTEASDAIRRATTTNPEGQEWSWRHVNESIYQAVSQAIANIFIFLGTLLTVPMLILQYVLRWLMYLVTPFMLAVLMLPGFAGVAVRFFQQVLAVLSWPVGFALTNLVALAVWNDFRSAVGTYPSTPEDMIIYAPLLTMMGGLLATLVIVVGMIATPVVMQALFVHGNAFSGASANPATIYQVSSRILQSLESRKSAPGSVDTRTNTLAVPPPVSVGAGPSLGI